MNLADITNNCANKVNRRIDYIFAAFKKEFAAVRYDERNEILGVGEPNKYLMCYYYRAEDDEPWVKFKTGDRICLSADIVDLDLCIDGTIQLFKENDLSLKSKQSKPDSEFEKYKLLFKEVDELIERFVSDGGAIEICYVAATRLTNALNNAGIIKISDLKGWSSSRLMKIRNFGIVCLEELRDILLDIKQPQKSYATQSENKCNMAAQACQRIAPEERSMRVYVENKQINDYLRGLNFDESCFNEDTVGYILCIREKLTQPNNINFCSDENVLCDEYIKNIDKLSGFYESTQTFFTDIADRAISDEFMKEVFLRLAFCDNEKNAVEELSEKYNLYDKTIRKKFKQSLVRLTHAFNLNYKSRLPNCIAMVKYFKQFEDCPFDVFILYLSILKKNYLIRAIYRVLLEHNQGLSGLRNRIKEAKALLNERQQAENTDSIECNTIQYKSFHVIVGDDGEILTDLKLLNKLQQKRFNIANTLDVPAYMVYTNKSLVLLATFKPLNKTMYASIKGFSEKTWDKYGCATVEVIKQHVDELAANAP